MSRWRVNAVGRFSPLDPVAPVVPAIVETETPEEAFAAARLVFAARGLVEFDTISALLEKEDR